MLTKTFGPKQEKTRLLKAGLAYLITQKSHKTRTNELALVVPACQEDQIQALLAKFRTTFWYSPSVAARDRC